MFARLLHVLSVPFLIFALIIWAPLSVFVGAALYITTGVSIERVWDKGTDRLMYLINGKWVWRKK